MGDEWKRILYRSTRRSVIMLLTPFLIGLAGSLHCIGMCGPLSSVVTTGGRRPILKKVYYNAGRIFTYAIMGTIISFFGGVTSLLGIQTWTSLIVGITMLLIGLTGFRVTPPRFIAKPLASLSGFLKSRVAVLLSMKNSYGVLAMGMVNGLLPCGMTWVALAYCITLQSPVDGFVAMTLFGLGTVPAMIGFPTLIHQLTTRFQISFRAVQTTLLIISGFLLIARTFSSPDATKDHGIVICGTHTTLQK
jgi:sulfite exporter TauE/SafE